jgi:endonuclease/exonuclease/phosphatase family metal-dependent hydrolase
MGPEGRGTAILLKNDLETRNLQRLPSGRACRLTYKTSASSRFTHRLVQKLKGRGRTFMIEVPKLIPTTPTELILAGDFNCTLASQDSTGCTNCSTALDTMVKTLDRYYMWTRTSRTPGYTYYGHRTASRIDRIYVPQQIQMRKRRLIWYQQPSPTTMQ